MMLGTTNIKLHFFVSVDDVLLIIHREKFNLFTCIVNLCDKVLHVNTFTWRYSPQRARVSWSRFHDHTHTHSVGLLWTSYQPDSETSTWQHTTLTRDRHSCHRRDSKPQSQEASDPQIHVLKRAAPGFDFLRIYSNIIFPIIYVLISLLWL